MPVKKRNNYYESDDDYDSDENITQPINTSAAVEDQKDVTLEAPHLQLDWLSDTSSNQGEIETDDDVIFVADRAEPIDLTADSDSENDSRANPLRLTLPIDTSSNIERVNVDAPISFNAPTNNTSSSTRAPIMSSVAPQVVITMNPRRTTPVPPRNINFHDMITGTDVMLYDGVSAQNFTTQPRPLVVENSTSIEPRHSNNSQQSNSRHTAHNSHNHHHNYHTNSNVAHNNNNPNVHHHHRRHHFYPSQQGAPQTQAQENNGSNVGRCPFISEGHHYNRPRRLPRDFYPSNGRPYAVHEDLWRRQYQEQEIRRQQYWSPNYNDNAPEVHLLRPPPQTVHTNDQFFHRLVPASSDNNPTSVPPNDILNRNIARMQRYRRSQWYTFLKLKSFIILNFINL
jgi:hypothetical protein